MRGKKYNYYVTTTALLSVLIATWIIQVMNGQMPYFDQWTRGLVASVQETYLFTGARLITELGSAHFLVPFIISVGLILAFVYKEILLAILFTSSTLVSHLLNKTIKLFVGRTRPRLDIAANAEGYSFPSGHAMISVVCYGLLIFMLAKKIKKACTLVLVKYSLTLLIILIGMSRVIINVHYLTDVLTGFVFGFIVLFMSIQVYEGVARRAPS